MQTGCDFCAPILSHRLLDEGDAVSPGTWATTLMVSAPTPMVEFDGNKIHQTYTFNGDRYCIVAFCPKLISVEMMSLRETFMGIAYSLPPAAGGDKANTTQEVVVLAVSNLGIAKAKPPPAQSALLPLRPSPHLWAWMKRGALVLEQQ
eukprot:s936_g16.t1